MSEAYKVKIDAFEGPLDLLLHLVNELELDIYDIPVAEITEQYMTYIDKMQTIELNIASEYLVMAATLLAIKSAMLLPKKEVQYDDDEYEEDPREELINRLIEYRKYKAVAEKLKEKEMEENQIFTRPPTQFDEHVTENKNVQGDLSIYDMLHALEKVFKRQSWNEPLETTVNRIEISIEQRMEEILILVHKSKKNIAFDQLFQFKNRNHIVTTFLAILQLLKTNKINCMQNSHFEPIYISKE